jgi:uncharacterized protein YcnI
MRSQPLRVLVTGAALFLLSAGAAQAHIQISPTVAAPLDSVKFTLLVPGESDANTTKVTLQMPAEVLPFSFSDPPGWTRKMNEAANGAIETIEWTGELPADGFVEFSFIAGTPEKPGTILWKTLQEYSDGTIVRWIGDPGSEEPAAVTEISADAPTQNAGGEGDEVAGGGEEPVTTTGGETEPATTTAASASESSSSSDAFARTLSIVALALAAVALVFVLRRRKT